MQTSTRPPRLHASLLVLRPLADKRGFLMEPRPKKNLMVESLFFFLAHPFQSGLLIRLQCLLDGAVRRPSTGADAHLSSHVALSRLRSVWCRACALIYSIFGPVPPPLPLSLGSLCEKEKEKINQLVPANKSKELQQNLDSDVATLLVGFNQWCSLVYSSECTLNPPKPSWPPQNKNPHAL